jgi:DNA-binding MarR family transcriptional regulator
VLDELTDAFLTSARALVALAIKSINAAPTEITLMQHRVLVLLASQGEQSMSVLADQLGVNASNASRVTGRLQRQGLVSRHRSAADARSVVVALTAEGMDLLRAVNRQRRREIRRILESVSPELGREAVEALRTFNEAAHERADADWIVPQQTRVQDLASRTTISPDAGVDEGEGGERAGPSASGPVEPEDGGATKR